MPHKARAHVTVREHEAIPYSILGGANASRLENFVERSGIRLFDFGRHSVKARSFVGLVRVGDQTIQVLPKIFEREAENLALLLILLTYTRNLRIRKTGLASIEASRGSFLEVWIRHFAEELNRLLLRDPRRRYRDERERVPFIKGKLLFQEDIAGQSKLDARYPCRFQVFDANHRLYQLLKYCNGLLLRLTAVHATKNILLQNDLLLASVEPRAFTRQEADSIRLTRLDRAYEPVLELSRLILARSTLDLRAGRISALAFVFDMNVLFEQFVAEFIRRHKAEIRLGEGRTLAEAEPQYKIGKLFGEFRMQVDLRLRDDAGAEVLLDTKYKRLDGEKAHKGLSQTDFYQMFAYANAGSTKFDEIVLLYPTTASVRQSFSSGQQRLHVTDIDVRRMVDLKQGSVDVGAAVAEFSRAFVALGAA